jgi:antibiotic biosynthesis monooxygenase (ABM) superfamily enzyme
MIDALTRIGVDLGGPTLVAYAVVALVAGLLGMAVGSFLELLRTRRVARLWLEREAQQPAYEEPAVAWSAGPSLAYAGYGGAALDAPSEPGLADWFTDSGLAVRRPDRRRMQVAVLVVLALFVIVATFGAAAALLGLVPPEFTAGYF